MKQRALSISGTHFLTYFFLSMGTLADSMQGLVSEIDKQLERISSSGDMPSSASAPADADGPSIEDGQPAPPVSDGQRSNGGRP